MNENSILVLYCVYFQLVLFLKFMWFIQMKESVIFNFLNANFLFYEIGYRQENQSVISPVINWHA